MYVGSVEIASAKCEDGKDCYFIDPGSALLLDKLKAAIGEKSPHLKKMIVFLLQGNAPPDTSMVTNWVNQWAELREFGIKFRDMAHYDFFLFHSAKVFLERQTLLSI